MKQLNAFIEGLNGILFSDYVVYALLFTGVLFTIWSGFGQFRALTHGVQVVRGKYDDKDDPGAINHFQALSAALSATVGLGNIAGVAVAVALGGPGAVLWMWLIGVLGMALKMTEVTQSMLARNIDDPENPHGGPMFVVQKGFAGWGLKPIGTAIGGIFVVTLIISAITGGNMFQAWNVADITKTYFGIPQVVTGIVLAVVVALVIIGGIKRIGSVAGRIVPVMCAIYVLAALYVLVVNIGEVPDMLMLIVRSGLPPALGGEAPDATGAFLGGTFGYAAMWGVKRALFSSEAGQGSSPVAHSAAKTDEPVREGVVAGLEPFIDTIVVCTLTALVILSSGAYNRESEASYQGDATIALVSDAAGELGDVEATRTDDGWTIETRPAPDRQPTEAEAETLDGEAPATWTDGEPVFVFATATPGERRRVIPGAIVLEGSTPTIDFGAITAADGEDPIEGLAVEQTLYHGALPKWIVDRTDLPDMTSDARRIRRTEEGRAGWRADETIFMVVSGDPDEDTGRSFRKLSGTVSYDAEADAWNVAWKPLESEIEPTFRSLNEDEPDLGIYGDYAGASLTAYAFDRVTPGLGMVLVSVAAWLFAVSTMISWSYYGEQGVYYLVSALGEKGTAAAVLIYKLLYCLLILVTTILAMPLPGPNGTTITIIGTDKQLDMWTTLGLGVMLVANIPIMLIFGYKAMGAYHDYFRRMKAGGDQPHDAPPITDVVEGKDVE